MIITQSISIHSYNLKYYEEIQKNNKIHLFTILSVKDAGSKFKTLTFSYNANALPYLMIDLFFAGKKAGIYETTRQYEATIKSMNHETINTNSI